MAKPRKAVLGPKICYRIVRHIIGPDEPAFQGYPDMFPGALGTLFAEVSP